jgi:hypothetical protein
MLRVLIRRPFRKEKTMSNALSAATRKRLTLTLALFAGLGLMIPASRVNATPPAPLCPLTQNTVVIYYSDAARTHQICAEIVYPCTGGGSTSNCVSSQTPYTRTICTACGVN